METGDWPRKVDRVQLKSQERFGLIQSVVTPAGTMTALDQCDRTAVTDSLFVSVLLNSEERDGAKSSDKEQSRAVLRELYMSDL